MTGTSRSTLLALAAACESHRGPAQAHGFARKRFFPATLVIDDPFVADGLSLPTVSYPRSNPHAH